MFVEDSEKISGIAKSLRSSITARGRAYTGTGVEPIWLANEIVEHCKTQGWKHSLQDVPACKAWLILSDNVAMLVEGTNNDFSITVQDLTPVYLKTVLAAGGLLALTGAFVVAAPLAGAAVWRAKSRAAKVESLLRFVDERVQSQSGNLQHTPTPGSAVDRMRDLVALRDQGFITSEEYETKKKELMRSL